MPPPVSLSVVIPARNERDNLRPLIDELSMALDAIGQASEIIVVDDNSSDGSLEVLRDLRTTVPRLRVLTLSAPRGGALGQSAAFGSGLRVARGDFLVTLDADLQNDPADIGPLLRILHQAGADLVQGDRAGRRCDGPVRRVSSAVARIARRVVIGDRVRDTGCSLRVMRRAVAACLSLEHRGMHRFIPCLAMAAGWRVVESPVSHRPRRSGRSNYGIRNRVTVGFVDAIGVRWMIRRKVIVESREIGSSTPLAACEITVRPAESRSSAMPGPRDGR